MFRQGPIPAAVHGILDYIAGALFIAAPFILSFHADAAVAASIVGGVLVLALTASTAWPPGLIKSVPVTAHAVLDLGLAAVAIACPFLFGFSGERAPTAFFIVAGVVLLLLTIATRFERPERAASRAAGAR
jgi:hypothetical protein